MDDSIEKILDESTSEEERKVLVEALSPEEKVSLAKKADKIFADSMAKAAAGRKEKNRVDELIKQKTEEVGKVNETMSQFRTEQVEKAKSRIKTEFDLDDAALKSVDEMFVRVDSGKVDVELIYQDYKAAYVATNSDTFLAAQQTGKDMEARAAAANANAAGSQSAPPPGKEPQKYSDEAVALAKAAGITEEQAEAQVTGGMKRVYK